MTAAVPTKAQAEIMKKHGMMPFIWHVLQEDERRLTVVHIVVGQIRVIDK